VVVALVVQVPRLALMELQIPVEVEVELAKVVQQAALVARELL
jgi:hypothetical protein